MPGAECRFQPKHVPDDRLIAELRTEAERRTVVSLIRHGWAGRIPVDTIERRIRRALPAITDDDLAAAFEQATHEGVEEADRLRQFID